jgi:hypothetical protein
MWFPECIRKGDISVSIVTGYRPEGWVSIPSRGKIFFSFPQHPD